MFEKWYVLENSPNIIFENKAKTILYFSNINFKKFPFWKKKFLSPKSKLRQN
jgi:hypothetical protein